MLDLGEATINVHISRECDHVTLCLLLWSCELYLWAKLTRINMTIYGLLEVTETTKDEATNKSNGLKGSHKRPASFSHAIWGVLMRQ